MKDIQKSFTLGSIFVYKKYNCLILFIYFHFVYYGCNIPKVALINEQCIPITFFALDEFENKKEFNEENIISLMRPRLCLAKIKKNNNELGIRIKTINFKYNSSSTLVKFTTHLWFMREIVFSSEVEYWITSAGGKTKSGFLKKEDKYNILESRTVPMAIFIYFGIGMPSLFGLWVIHPLATTSLFSDLSLLESLNDHAVKQMADNLAKEIVAKANQDIKE